MTMTAAETLKNRLATIHKDMAALSEAVSLAASDVENRQATMAITIERRLTDDLEERASRLARMVRNEDVANITAKVYSAAMRIVDAFLHQRHNCKRSRAQFIAHGDHMSALIESGVFQVLIAKRKAAKAAVEVEQAPADTVADGYPSEWVYFQCKPTFGWDVNIRRVRTNADVYGATEVLINGSWEASRLTLGEMRTMIAFGSAEFVDAPRLKMVKPSAPEWVYFVRNTAAETLRRYDASGLSDASQVMGVNGFQDSVLTATEAKRKIEKGFARVVEAPEGAGSANKPSIETGELNMSKKTLDPAFFQQCKEGLIMRITQFAHALEHGTNLDEFVIVSPLMAVAYTPSLDGGYLRPGAGIANAKGFSSRSEAECWAPAGTKVVSRRVAIQSNLVSSQEALARINEVVG